MSAFIASNSEAGGCCILPLAVRRSSLTSGRTAQQLDVFIYKEMTPAILRLLPTLLKFLPSKSKLRDQYELN
jgi:hypothetical protein